MVSIAGCINLLLSISLCFFFVEKWFAGRTDSFVNCVASLFSVIRKAHTMAINTLFHFHHYFTYANEKYIFFIM